MVELYDASDLSLLDTGEFAGDRDGGTITWADGTTSTYEREGNDYRVDGALGSENH